MTGIYEFTVEKLQGGTEPLSDYQGQVLLIVNTASACGFTPQYGGLEELHRKYHERGFSVLGFPSNQFGNQEPGSAMEIATFCDVNYHVTFPLFAKIDVNGPNAHPLYDYLTRAKRGLLGTRSIKWNFTKFLVGREGEVLGRYPSITTPEQLERRIAAAL